MKKYYKPVIEQINLVAEQAVLTSCKLPPAGAIVGPASEGWCGFFEGNLAVMCKDNTS